jgi:hypothetical protein
LLEWLANSTEHEARKQGRFSMVLCDLRDAKFRTLLFSSVHLHIFHAFAYDALPLAISAMLVSPLPCEARHPQQALLCWLTDTFSLFA